MAIITISRELAALGDETAHELAKLMAYRIVDKQALEQRITSYGFEGRKLEKYDERKPSFWASLSQDRDDYLHFIRKALFAEAESGNCIFVGRGANIILRDLPSVLSVRLVAPPAVRMERVKSYFRCDDKRARQIIEQSDKDREGFHRYFFDMEWGNPEYYHATFNTGLLHPSAAAELIRMLLDRLVTPDIERSAAERIKDLVLAQDTVHHILYERKISIHFLEAKSDGGAVTLHGVANSQASVEAAVSAAQEVPRVASVRSEIQVVQEYSVMP